MEKSITIKYEPTIRVGSDAEKISAIVIRMFDAIVISHDENNGILILKVGWETQSDEKTEEYVKKIMGRINLKMPMAERVN